MGRGRREEACEGCGKESHGPRLGGRGAVRRTKDPVRKHILCNFEIPDEEREIGRKEQSYRQGLRKEDEWILRLNIICAGRHCQF
jgi:hypothetical protein